MQDVANMDIKQMANLPLDPEVKIRQYLILIFQTFYYAFPTGSVYMDLVENSGGGGGGRQEIEKPQGM